MEMHEYNEMCMGIQSLHKVIYIVTIYIAWRRLWHLIL